MTTEDPFPIPRVERDAKVKQSPLTPPSKSRESTPLFLLVALSSLLKRALRFTDKRSLKTTPSAEFTLVLSQIKKYLLQLTEDDRTEEAGFTAQLAAAWNQLLGMAAEMNDKSFFYFPIYELIAAFNRFPPKEHHSFGYYLSHYAGETWLPFPYLDILRALHRDYLVEGPSSDLHQWLYSIDAILGIH